MLAAVAGMVAICAVRLAAQTAAIDGLVVDQVSGAPIERVHVTFFPEGSQPFENNPAAVIYGAMSDKAGHISITGLAPGRYGVQLSRSGYVQSPAADGAGASVVLKAGEPITDLKLEMAPSAMVSGRVVDENGDPVEHTSVQLVPAKGSTGSIVADERFAPSGGSTDERGEFRIVAGPGKFYVEAEPARFGLPLEALSDGTSAPEYAKTYFPDAAAKDRASVVEVTAGRDVDGLEIHLVAKAAQQRYTISGTVTNLPEGSSAFVIARPVDHEPEPMPHQGFAREGGKFSIAGLTPGAYDLTAGAAEERKLSGGARVTVTSADLGGVEIALGPPPELTGTVELSGGSQLGGAAAAKRTVRLGQAMEGIEAAFISGVERYGRTGDVAQDGAFRISGIEPGRFNPVVEPLPENAYISGVEFNGSPAAGGVIELTAADRAPRLKITVALDGASVSGKVLNEAGEPLEGDGVVLLLASPDVEGVRGRQVKSGRYEFKGVKPGKYRLVLMRARDVFASFNSGDNSQVDETLRKAFEAAEEIEIGPGAQFSKDLHAKP